MHLFFMAQCNPMVLLSKWQASLNHGKLRDMATAIGIKKAKIPNKVQDIKITVFMYLVIKNITERLRVSKSFESSLDKSSSLIDDTILRFVQTCHLT